VLAEMTASLNAIGSSPAFGTWAGGYLFADGREYRIALYDWDGKLVRILHRDVKPSKWSKAYAEAQFEEFRQAPPGRRLSASALERKREEYLESSHPHFNRLTPLSTDGAGRLWVVGNSGDSAYADVFSPEAHLGRLELPCPGFDRGWSVNGNWLAMACAPTDPDYEGDAVLKLFRIH
jgi:hypothetical protein